MTQPQSFDDLVEAYVTTGRELARVQAAHAKAMRDLHAHPAGRDLIKLESAIKLAAVAEVLASQVEKTAQAMRAQHEGPP